MNKFIAAVLTLAWARATADDRIITMAGQRETLHQDGKAIHPLLKYQRADVIVYPEIGAFSTRMTAHEQQDSTAISSFERAIDDTFVTFTNY